MPLRVFLRFVLFGPFALMNPQNKQVLDSGSGRTPAMVGMAVWAIWVIAILAFAFFASQQYPDGVSVRYEWTF